VIYDEWPVEQIKSFDMVEFPEDEEAENRFDLWKHFVDIDGGTNFEIVPDSSHFVKVEIDKDNFLDFSTNKQYWNTGDGYVEVIIIARDSNPVQAVYSIIKVKVIPVNNAPTLMELPQANVTIKVPGQIDLSAYISDVDTDLSDIEIKTGIVDKVNIVVSGTLLIITAEKTGEIPVEVWVLDDYGESSQPKTLTIKSVKGKEPSEVDNTYLYAGIIALVIIIIVILLAFLIVFSSYKVKEVFLIHKSGILLSHLSREHKPGRDEEILSGMFTAVQEFIRDSFSEQGRPSTGSDDHILREMKIGENNNILIERGKYVYLAVIFSGRGAGKLRNRVNGILSTIETKYESAFKTWVGDMDKISGVENILQPLLPSGGTQVIATDKQLGRVSPPPGIPTAPAHPAPARPAAPAAAVPAKTITPAKPISPAPAQAAPTPKPEPAQAPAPVSAKPAVAATPAAAVPTPTPAPAAPTPTTTTPVTAQPATTDAGNCPKCGAVPNKFPDGSMLCPKCGYTGK
jgi:hypothetical protein